MHLLKIMLFWLIWLALGVLAYGFFKAYQIKLTSRWRRQDELSLLLALTGLFGLTAILVMSYVRYQSILLCFRTICFRTPRIFRLRRQAGAIAAKAKKPLAQASRLFEKAEQLREQADKIQEEAEWHRGLGNQQLMKAKSFRESPEYQQALEEFKAFLGEGALAEAQPAETETTEPEKPILS